jgi:hypothetical protein
MGLIRSNFSVSRSLKGRLGLQLSLRGLHAELLLQELSLMLLKNLLVIHHLLLLHIEGWLTGDYNLTRWGLLKKTKSASLN